MVGVFCGENYILAGHRACQGRRISDSKNTFDILHEGCVYSGETLVGEDLFTVFMSEDVLRLDLDRYLTY